MAATEHFETGTDVREAYLSLLQSALTMTLWNAGDGAQMRPLPAKVRVLHALYRLNPGRTREPTSAEQREEGRDWPVLAHSMIGTKRMSNLRACVETVLRENVRGDLIETGVWRGGACIFMRGILKAYGITDRTVWVADSFAGLPEPDPAYPADAGDRHHLATALAVSLDEVRANFERYGLLDDQVQFLEGWFKDTLPKAPIGQLAVARLDGDMYESTTDALNALYPKLSPGGFLIVDDYKLANCRAAVTDYRQRHGITEPIEAIDYTGAYWRRAD